MELVMLVIGSLLGYVLGGVLGWRALAFPVAVMLAILATADSGDGPPEAAMAILAEIAIVTATAAGTIAGGSPDE